MSTANRHARQRELSRASLQKTQRWITLFSSLLISAMMTLFAVGFAAVASSFGLPVTGMVLIPFIFLVSLETLYAREIGRRLLRDFRRSGYFHLAEFLLLASILRLLLLFFGSTSSRWASFLQQLRTPLAAWFVPEYMLSVLFLLLVWIFLRVSYQDMALLYNLSDYTDWEQVGKEQVRLSEKRSAFLSRFGVVGIVLLIGMIFSGGSWQPGGGVRFLLQGDPLRLIWVITAYFFLLLLLMSQTQFARLRTRWWLNHSVIQPQVQQRWLRSSLIFFFSAILIALLSPTGFAEQLFIFLQQAFLFVMVVVQLLIGFLFAAIATLFGFLLPDSSEPPTQATIPTPQSFEETAQTLVRQPPAWLDAASDVIVWLLLGGVILFALLQYLRQDRSLGAEIAAFLRRMLAFLRQAWRSLRQGVSSLTGTIQSRRKRGTDISEMHLPPEIVSASSGQPLEQPRAEIFRFYQRFLASAKAFGSGRKAHQTPLQYEAELRQQTEASAGEPIHQITETFDTARYSRQPMSQEEVRQMSAELETLRKHLPKK